MFLFLFFLLLGSLSAGIAQTVNLTLPVTDLKLKNLSNSLDTTTGHCSSFLICYDDEMPRMNGKLTKRFQLVNYNAIKKNKPNGGQPCAKQQHWVDLSTDSEDQEKIRAEFSFGEKAIRFANLTLEDLDEHAQAGGAFLDDNDCKKWLQIFALELHFAKNVNIWKHNDCKWKFPTNGTTSTHTEMPTDVPVITLGPETKMPKETTPITPSTTDSSTTTVTTTTEPPTTTTSAPVHWKKLIKADSFGAHTSAGEIMNQTIILVRGVLESWAKLLLLNVCPDNECDEGANGRIYMQFGVSFNDDGAAEDCWLNAFENSKWGVNASCNGTTTSLFKRGENFELVLAFTTVPGVKLSRFFIVKFGTIEIANYTRPGLKSPIYGDLFVELRGNLRHRENVPDWAIHTLTTPIWIQNMNKKNFSSDNLQLLGHVPMFANGFQIELHDGKVIVLVLNVDYRNRTITLQRALKSWDDEIMPIPGPIPFAFEAGEDFDLRVIKKSCKEGYNWIILMNGKAVTVEAHDDELTDKYTIWAKFTYFFIDDDFIYYGYKHMPSVNKNCNPK